jgi:hypothetical protein
LLNRINQLIKNYDLQEVAKFYINCQVNEKAIRKELSKLGGVYLWWCSSTGMFYIGSTKSFSGHKDSRLIKYFQYSRLVRTDTSKHISRDIARDMLNIPKSHWNLIILEICGESERLSKTVLFEREQFWMLLIPTYNRSLVVGTHSVEPIDEDTRQKRSTIIYRFTIKDGVILPESELEIFGIKEAARLLKISLYDLQAHRKSGQLYKGEYLFCNSPLSSEAQFQWRDPSMYTKFTSSSKSTPVWVYDALTLKFIKRYDSLKSIKAKYNLPQTSLNRALNHRLALRGLIFSRVNLTK